MVKLQIRKEASRLSGCFFIKVTSGKHSKGRVSVILIGLQGMQEFTIKLRDRT